MRWPRRGLLVCLAALTAGCAVGPDFVRPESPAVDRYDTVPIELPAPGGVDATQRLGAAITRDWWALLQSPDLDDAIAQAIAASPTLESARAALAQADEVVNAARGAYYPQIDGSASASRQGTRTYGRNPSSLTTKIFSFGPLFSYTPDVFGRDRRFVEQQGALAANQLHQLAGAYVTLTASVATEAVTIASTLAQIRAAEDVVAADEHNLELVRIAYAAGSVARTDALSAPWRPSRPAAASADRSSRRIWRPGSPRRSSTAARSWRSGAPRSTRTRRSSARTGKRCSWPSARSPTCCKHCSTTRSSWARRTPP